MDDRGPRVEALARMAALWAGRDPDQQLRFVLGEIPVFEGAMWRYPEFLDRAEAAYLVLTTVTPLPVLNGVDRSVGGELSMHL